MPTVLDRLRLCFHSVLEWVKWEMDEDEIARQLTYRLAWAMLCLTIINF